MRTTMVLVPIRNQSWNVRSVARLVTSRGIAEVVDAIAGWIDSGAPTYVCKDRCWFKTFEQVEDGYVLYMGDDHFAPVHRKGSVMLEFSLGKSITLFNVFYVPKLRKNLVSGPMAVVRLSGLKRKTLGKKSIDCIFFGYAEHSKAYRFYVIKLNDSVSINSIIESRDAIFDENHFSSIPRPKDIIPNLDEYQRDDHSDDVPSEIPKPCKGKRVWKAKSYSFDFQLYLIEGLRDQVGSQYSNCYSIEEDPRTYNEDMYLEILLSRKKQLMMRLVLLWKIIHEFYLIYPLVTNL
nr:zinc finger, CCHC-type [Tanacetum cinerariifolium]